MKHLEEKFNRTIVNYFKEKYNFHPNVDELCQELNWVSEGHHSFPMTGRNGIPLRLLTKWWRTTRIKGEIHNHSAHGFATYLDSHFIFIPVKRNKWYSGIVTFLLRKMLK